MVVCENKHACPITTQGIDGGHGLVKPTPADVYGWALSHLHPGDALASLLSSLVRQQYAAVKKVVEYIKGVIAELERERNTFDTVGILMIGSRGYGISTLVVITILSLYTCTYPSCGTLRGTNVKHLHIYDECHRSRLEKPVNREIRLLCLLVFFLNNTVAVTALICLPLNPRHEKHN